VQSGAIDEEGVIAKQPIELCNCRMSLWHGLGLELAQGAFDHL
jgi:hypothetical protein